MNKERHNFWIARLLVQFPDQQLCTQDGNFSKT